jgi:hypothetical protein
VTATEAQRWELTQQRNRIRAETMLPREQRPASPGHPSHHADLLRRAADCRVLPDLPGSIHFYFDVGNGNGNTVAFFDLPGVDVRSVYDDGWPGSPSDGVPLNENHYSSHRAGGW